MAWYNVQKGQNMGISSYMVWVKEDGRGNNGEVEIDEVIHVTIMKEHVSHV